MDIGHEDVRCVDRDPVRWGKRRGAMSLVPNRTLNRGWQRSSPSPIVVGSSPVFDEDSPLSKRVREQLADKTVLANLLKYARWRTKTEWDAEDLLGDAIASACEPNRKPWDPTKRTFFRHMRFVMDDLAIENARSGYARFEEVGSEIDFDEILVDPRPLADDALDAARTPGRLLRWGERLRDRVKERAPPRPGQGPNSRLRRRHRAASGKTFSVSMR